MKPRWPRSLATLLAALVTVCTQARDFGPDVSHFQGETGISQAGWNQMFTEGKRFTFVKATEGFSVIDPATPNNMARATAAGLRAGVYHFAHPDTHPTRTARSRRPITF